MRSLLSTAAVVAAALLGAVTVAPAAGADQTPRIIESSWTAEVAAPALSGDNAAAAADHGVDTDARAVEGVYGIPVRNQEKFQGYADESRYLIDVRPTNPESVRWLNAGGLPKPQFLKSKTINPIDVLLGAKSGMEGTVGFFEPVLPDRDSVPADQWDKVEGRYKQRWNEYQELEAKMRKLEADGTIVIDQGVVYGYDKSHRLQPYTGDHDLFNIRTESGEMLGQDEYDTAIATMISMDMGVQHGAHMYWHPTSDFEKNIYETIIAQHQPGKEPLVRFAPHQTMRLVYADTPVA